MSNFFRLYFTLSNLKFVQLSNRIVRYIRLRFCGKWMNRIIYKLSVPAESKSFNLQKGCELSSFVDLSRNQFKFINKEVAFQSEILWNDPAQEKLWLYYLHYFDYLSPLFERIDKQNYDLAKNIIQKWIKQNPVAMGNGWEPYPISLRLVNWLFFYIHYSDFIEQDESFKAEILTSIYHQSFYLSKNIEYHLQANHLFVNAKALFFVAVFFHQSRWIKKSIKLLNREIDKQILPDGGHYERSPMYHALLLKDILDLMNLVKNNPISTGNTLNFNKLHSTVEKMLQYHKALLHPDGQIALLGDSALDATPSYEGLYKYFLELKNRNREKSVKIESVHAFAQSGYFILNSNSQYLVIDGGPLGVLYQPGHAHCDIFSFEYSYSGLRFIVDSGIGNYLPTELRQKARSIYSHNTVVVNQMEQAQLWSAFRMGKRVSKPIVTFDEKKKIFIGKYKNNIEPKKSYIHQRELLVQDDGTVLINDEISGRSIKSVESLLHFHPACGVRLSNNMIEITNNKISIFIIFDRDSVTVSLNDWFYVEEFGKVIQNKVAVFKPKNMSSQSGRLIITLKIMANF